MKQFKLIRYDLKNGILCKWHSYMVPFLLALAFFADYSIRVWNRYGNEALFGGRVTLGDYLLYCFSGKRPYNPAEQVFLVPIAWLMIFVCSMLVTLNYSLQNLTGHGVQVMIRTQKRYRWWLAKCVYILGSTCCYFGIFYVTLCVACLVSGTPCTLQYTSDIMQRVLDYTFSVSPMSTELAIAFFVMPLCTALSLNMLQMWLELYLKRIYAFMTAAVILLLATYLQNPLLPGVYAMVIRSSWVTEGGTLWQKGLLLDGMLFLVAVAGGLIWIRRYDMIPRE